MKILKSILGLEEGYSIVAEMSAFDEDLDKHFG